MLKTPEEIIAKKIHFRGYNLQPRDMFDIAAVAREFGCDTIATTLATFPEENAKALKVVESLDKALVRRNLDELNIMPKFENLRETAQCDTVSVLKKALV